MLKITVSPGETIMIGEDIKIIFGGGGKSHIPVGIEAPREQRVIRSSAQDKQGFESVNSGRKVYVEKPLSDDARDRIRAIVVEDRRKNRQR